MRIFTAIFVRQPELPFKGKRLQVNRKEINVTANTIEHANQIVKSWQKHDKLTKLKGFELLGFFIPKENETF